MTTSAIPTPVTPAPMPRWARFIQPTIALFARIPDSLIALLERFSIAAGTGGDLHRSLDRPAPCAMELRNR
jgi:hypothetical protein